MSFSWGNNISLSAYDEQCLILAYVFRGFIHAQLAYCFDHSEEIALEWESEMEHGVIRSHCIRE